MKGRRMKTARMRRGYTQLNLAHRAGCSEALISKVETGRVQPDSELRKRIARILGISSWEVRA